MITESDPIRTFINGVKIPKELICKFSHQHNRIMSEALYCEDVKDMLLHLVGKKVKAEIKHDTSGYIYYSIEGVLDLQFAAEMEEYVKYIIIVE